MNTYCDGLVPIPITWSEDRSDIGDLNVYYDPERKSVWLDRPHVFEEEFGPEDCRRLISALQEALSHLGE